MEHLTPNGILESLPFPVVQAKPALDQQVLKETMVDLPVNGGGEVIGQGDWNRDRSDGGSAVVEISQPKNGRFVAKIPLGKLQEDGWEQTKRIKCATDLLHQVSPPTLVVLTGRAKEDAKPLILQKRIEGTPLCRSFLREIINRQVLEDIKLICRQMRASQEVTQASDLFGQRIKKPWSFFVNSTFLFSDNIMLANGRAVLVDNAPCQKITSPLKKKIHSLRLAMTETVISIILKNLKS